MRDYSLMGLPSLAVEGQTLAVHRYPTGSKGVGPVSASCQGIWGMVNSLFRPAPLLAVCIPPGSRLLLANVPASLQPELGVSEEEEVTFNEVDAVAHRYRDAVRFASGTEVLLQHLPPGQRVRVLRLDSAQPVLPDVEERLRGLASRSPADPFLRSLGRLPRRLICSRSVLTVGFAVVCAAA